MLISKNMFKDYDVELLTKTLQYFTPLSAYFPYTLAHYIIILFLLLDKWNIYNGYELEICNM